MGIALQEQLIREYLHKNYPEQEDMIDVRSLISEAEEFPLNKANIEIHIIKESFKGETEEESKANDNNSSLLKERLIDLEVRYRNLQKRKARISLQYQLSPSETQNETQNESENEEIDWVEILKKSNSVAILGGRRTGKTAIGFDITRYTYKEVYVFGYPQKVLPLGYASIKNVEDLPKLKDSVIYWDEPHLTLKVYENSANWKFIKLLSTMAQKGNILITSTSDSRFYTRSLESYLDTWIIKDIDFDTLKQGSKASKIIRKHVLINPEGFSLNKNEYLVEDRATKTSSKGTFELPEFWNDSLSHAFRDVI